ncbi:phenylalanine--tRNA ligase subunit beta [Campylobacter suis]|uniref:Phenylalanine--tRNA ligase beta subunit n=1 Tax=Campylobacter suis TaxID=2790657 RepID=A0ABN7K489_9BACT|nr:phenylalanine--tRNA ligase subunit beta [Campylobacter suis]CAD7287361.1 Phenylalanine--tRNA ligase beta subunit [Campylobacter suis]
MIISKHWLNEYIDLSAISGEEISKTLNSIGLEVDSYKEIKIPKTIVIGYVKSKQKHPDADKLNVCDVDVGSETLQIVCGAKNVESGQFVAVALVGTTMPNGLEIKKAKLRGVESCGMICSSTELGLVKINDGIMVLDDSIGELKLGKSLSEFEAFNDVIIEVDVTANRGDCQSINGIARDLCVAFDLNLKENSRYDEPENLPGIGRIVALKTDEGLKSSFLYKAVELKGQMSENLLTKLRLALIECEKTSPLERVLEYATYSTGVLFRAYDFAKLQSDERVSFEIKKGEFSQSIVSSNGKILSVAGIYQDDVAKIDDSSKLVIIEANYSEPDVVAESVALDKNMPRDEHLYRASRASRGSEPTLSYGMDYLFKRLCTFKELRLYAGASGTAIKKEQTMLSFSTADISRMVGQEITRAEILRILKKLGFEINFNQESETFNVKVPFFRHDILNTHDVCEEIVRIVGIDNIASKPLKFSEENRINDTYKSYKFALNLRRRAAGAGFFESVHYVFDNSQELLDLGFVPCKTQILNPINAELNMLRPTLANHLLSSCEKNIKNSKKSVKLFEYGEVFSENGKQSHRIGFVMSGLKSEPTLLSGAKPEDVDFISFVSAVQNAIGEFSLKPSDEISYLSPFEQARIIKDGIDVGYVGRVHISFENARDLPKTYLCEINFDSLKDECIKAKPYSKFPSILRDLSLIVPDGLCFAKISECIKSLNITQLKEFAPVDIYRSADLGSNASVGVKFVFQDIEKTLEDSEVAAFMDKILDALKRDLNIGLR